ncbi:MAG: 3-oxoacyl-ACP reductase FabG [Haloferacaceae archaeon]
MSPNRTRDGDENENGGRFAGDVAVVTGGTRGIGRAAAERLAAAGATTVATYARDDRAAAEAGRALQDLRGESAVRRFDVRDFDAVAAAFEAISEEFGPPTVLVNAAGVMANALLVRMDPADWRRVIDTNLTGTFHCTREAARLMLRADGGRIVNVSSVAARRGWAGQANYAASKAGVVGLTRAVARELGGRSIRVNAVCPGYTDTDLYRSELGDVEDVPDAIPAGRVADPDEVAAAVCFLASADASYVNGATLRVDGGLLG